MNEWRDIESAPRVNGSRYLVGQFGLEGDTSEQNGTIASVRWWRDHWRAEGTEERLYYCEPTHWMPLPAPPLTTAPAPATQPDTPAK